jgi:hypothetical protein
VIPKQRAVVAAVAALALVVGGWYVFTWSGASLEAGDTAGAVAGLSSSGVGGGWKVRDGSAEFAFAQSVRNTSRVGVTLTGITSYPDKLFDVDAGYLTTEQYSAVQPTTAGRAFPVRLRPGGELMVLMRYRHRRCPPMAPGSGWSFEQMQVRYRLYGVGRTADITFPAPFTASAEALQHDGVCPNTAH